MIDRPDESQLKFRVKSSLRERLESASEQNRRSLNMEIVDRLERSLDPRRDSEDEDETANAIAAVLGRLMYVVGHQTGGLVSGSPEGSKTWRDSPYAYEQVSKAVTKAMEAFRPDGDPLIGPPNYVSNNIGTLLAERFLSELDAAEIVPGVLPAEIHPRHRRICQLKEMLGSLAERLKKK